MSDEAVMPPEGDGSESQPSGPDAKPVRLRCLAGGPMPPEIVRDATRLRKLPPRVIQELEPILRACVLQPMTAEVGDQLSRFCLRNEVAEADLGGVLKACGWLLREAAALDLSAAELGQDAAAIFGDAAALTTILQAEYGPFKRAVREELLRGALVKHGNVLSDIDWRVDSVITERRAPKLETPVALVTFTYDHAGGTGRLTLQITPDELARVAKVLSALAHKTALAAAARGGEHRD